MQIPLMPLHAVLFPGMPMPLAIFEERYLRMLEECLDNEAPFGVALIRNGPEVGGVAEPYDIGTVAEIAHTESADDGVRTIVVGRQRFRVDFLSEDDGLLRAEVDLLDMDDADARASAELCGELAEMLQNHIRIIFDLLGLPEHEVSVPDEPERLSFMVAAHLTVSLGERQRLLELDRPADRLVRARELLRKEGEQYRLLLAARRRAADLQLGQESAGPFLSAN